MTLARSETNTRPRYAGSGLSRGAGTIEAVRFLMVDPPDLKTLLQRIP
jgi:hypothetical protein